MLPVFCGATVQNHVFHTAKDEKQTVPYYPSRGGLNNASSPFNDLTGPKRRKKRRKEKLPKQEALASGTYITVVAHLAKVLAHASVAVACSRPADIPSIIALVVITSIE